MNDYRPYVFTFSRANIFQSMISSLESASGAPTLFSDDTSSQVPNAWDISQCLVSPDANRLHTDFMVIRCLMSDDLGEGCQRPCIFEP